MSEQYRVPITAIQRFTVRDGPGIRTTVFFKGCSMHCLWCHNPETISSKAQMCFREKKCVGCGACAQICPRGKFTHHRGEFVFDAKCVDCGKCIKVCPTAAIEEAAIWMTVDEVIQATLRDRLFYRGSGGVTLSGGEPLLQPLLIEILRGICKAGVHTAVDTALNVPWSVIEAIRPYTGLFLADIKAIDGTLHRRLTQSDNSQILSNIRALASVGCMMWIRVPVIPGYNDHEIPKIAAFVRSLGRNDIPVELIPYHNMAAEKYAMLGLKMPLKEVDPPSAERMDELYHALEGIPCVTYE